MLLGDVEGRGRAIDAGVVHEDVDAPEVGLGAVHHGAQVGARGHIGLRHHGAAAEGAHFLGGALGARLVQLGDDDVGTQLRQLERGGAADTAAGAGDDRDLSL